MSDTYWTSVYPSNDLQKSVFQNSYPYFLLHSENIKYFGNIIISWLTICMNHPLISSACHSISSTISPINNSGRSIFHIKSNLITAIPISWRTYTPCTHKSWSTLITHFQIAWITAYWSTCSVASISLKCLASYSISYTTIYCFVLTDTTHELLCSATCWSRLRWVWCLIFCRWYSTRIYGSWCWFVVSDIEVLDSIVFTIVYNTSSSDFIRASFHLCFKIVVHSGRVDSVGIGFIGFWVFIELSDDMFCQVMCRCVKYTLEPDRSRS